MLSIVQSPESLADLDDIWFYIAPDNIAAADAVLERIGSVYPKLAAFPNMGTPSDCLPADLLHFPVGDYIIVYRITADELVIMRVLHGARKLEAIFS